MSENFIEGRRVVHEGQGVLKRVPAMCNDRIERGQTLLPRVPLQQARPSTNTSGQKNK